MKLTKVVATIGPSCESEEMIASLIQEGVNVFRFNFKHNSIEWHRSLMKRVNAVSQKLNSSIGIMLDLQGPEIRIKLNADEITLSKDKEVIFGTDSFTISHPGILPHIPDGQHIVIDDGQFIFTFKRRNNNFYLLSHQGGIL